MSKLKVLLLCLSTAVLTVGVMLSTLEFKIDKSVPILQVTGPSKVSYGDVVEFKAAVKNPSWFLSKTIYQWKVVGSNGEVNYYDKSPSNIFFPAGLANDKLHVIASAVNYHNYLLWSNVSSLDIQSSCVIVGNGPTPPPGPTPPDPGPTPPPPGPTPVTDKLFVVGVFDNTQAASLTPDQIAVKGSQTIQPALTSLNAHWFNYDKSNPVLSDATWQKYISSKTLPVIIILNDKGKEFYCDSLKNEADTISQVKTLRGTK